MLWNTSSSYNCHNRIADTAVAGSSDANSSLCFEAGIRHALTVHMEALGPTPGSPIHTIIGTSDMASRKTSCLLHILCTMHLFILLLAVHASDQTAPALQQQQQSSLPVCKGLGRRPVDWWIMLKHPAGYLYSYIDSSTVGDCPEGTCWRHRLTMLNPNPVGHTLALLAQAKGRSSTPTDPTNMPIDLAYTIYNDDDPPGFEHFDFAHAKGVVAFSSSNINGSTAYQGFWLIHSAPRFPKDPAQPGFADLAKAQSVFGQHFSCFSLSGKQHIIAVAEMLLAAGPYIYNSSISETLAAAFPTWQLLLNGTSAPVPMSVSILMQTASGMPLHGFSKTKYLKVSLTDIVVGPGLSSTMLWETWRRSHDALPSQCPEGATDDAVQQYSSLNIQRISFPGTPYTWASITDHSKWGISTLGSSWYSSRGAVLTDEESQHVLCLGDMNRAWWQSRRGGSFLCAQHFGLWQAFNSIIAAVEPCNRTVVT